MQKFKNQTEVVNRLAQAVHSNERIAIYGDHDVDGLMSLLVFKDLFEQLDYDNARVYPYSERTHNIEDALLGFCVTEECTLAIICDTGSSDMDILESFKRNNIDCVVLDHHTTKYTYDDFPENVSLVNTVLDRDYDIDNTMCGGGISFAVASALSRVLDFDMDRGYFAVYGLLAQYADAIPMDTEFGRYIYGLVKGRKSTPSIVQMFFNTNAKSVELNEHGQRGITKRFAQYTFAPKVNAAFRAENFDLLRDLFLIESTNKEELFENLVDQHAKTIDIVGQLLDKVHIEIINDVVVANLSTIHTEEYTGNFIVNQKGRVANALASKYRKACICVCDDGTQIQGSLRDAFDRDLLQFFKGKIECGGHGPAFGFKIEYGGWDSLLDIIKSIELSTIPKQKPRSIVQMKYGLDVLALSQFAFDNEFVTNSSQATCVRIYLKNIKEASRYGLAYLVWSDGVGSLWASSSKKLTQPGYVTLYPYLSNGTRVEMVWNEVDTDD